MPISETMLSLTGAMVSGERVQPSGAVGTIFCCGQCLTRLYSRNSTRPGLVVVRAGTLDGSAMVRPSFHLWTQSMQPWVVIPDGAIALAQQPASLAEWVDLLTPEPK